MRVALITNFCTHYRYGLFKRLSEKYGFDIYFFADEKRTKEDIKHLGLIKDDRFYFWPINRIMQELVRRKYQVVIKCTNNKWAFIKSLLSAKIVGAKFIVWHSLWFYPDSLQYRLFAKLFLRILMKVASAIIVYGKHGKEFLIGKGIDAEKIFIGWQAVDNKLFGRYLHGDLIQSLKDDLGIAESKTIVLYVGRLAEFKGIEYLLSSLDRLDKQRFIFVVVGHGDLKDKIAEYCAVHQIDYRLIGPVRYQDLSLYYAIASVLVLPSITTKTFREPWGLVVNEAFNQGCPVVVTDAVGAGVGGLVTHGVNGLIVPEKDVGALASAIGRILSDDNLREKFSHNALIEIKKWTYERQAKGFLDAIEYSLKK